MADIQEKRKQQAKLLRVFRQIHRTTGAFLFIFFFVVSISGLMLGWKDHSGGIFLPSSQRGTSTNLGDWLTIDSLQTIAFKVARDSVSKDIALDLNRIDARPSKGMVKFLFREGYVEIQLDGATGKVLSIAKRNSDLIENLHDGSYWDKLLGTSDEQIKLIYTNILGLALLTFTITGFWLWFGPKRLRKLRLHNRPTQG